MTLWNTNFERLSFAVVSVFFVSLLLLILRFFVAALLSVGALIMLGIIWRRVLLEELILSSLKDKQGYGNYGTLSRVYSAHAISHLEKKAIITVKNGVVELIDKNYVCTFDKFKRT